VITVFPSSVFDALSCDEDESTHAAKETVNMDAIESFVTRFNIALYFFIITPPIFICP
jgi:hypothetical protein